MRMNIMSFRKNIIDIAPAEKVTCYFHLKKPRKILIRITARAIITMAGMKTLSIGKPRKRPSEV
ncbi:hypothetical protein [Oxobacter pfennigii]|uniref:hypothetical protein n=1 Tax=Oxobacter pfennigii TaxID=36849 RepID=UPI001364951E|nr:hypothetical protein [Oxobacter pfennigii]